MKEYVVGFAFDPAGTQVALVLKRRPQWQAGRLNGVGGKVERYEQPLQAMHREWREEAGSDRVEWKLFATLEGANDEVRLQDAESFRAWFFRGVANRIETQTDEAVAWFNAYDLPGGALPNLHWLLPMARERQRQDWPFRVVERAHEAIA